MSDWVFLNQHRVRTGPRASDDSFGFCGQFVFRVNGVLVLAQASDGALKEGEPRWQHVSVSLVKTPSFVPSYESMCKIKDLFWEPQDWVVQFHPAKSEYVNMHPGVLHLWRPLDQPLPTPPHLMVGFKEQEEFLNIIEQSE